jgi:hypothetical protein
LFTILSPPSSPPSKTRSAPFIQIGSNLSYGAKINYYPYLASDRVTTFIVDTTDILIVGNKLVLIIDKNIDNLVEIKVNGNKYTLAIDSDNPQKGEFVFDYNSKEAVVYLYSFTGELNIIYKASKSYNLDLAKINAGVCVDSLDQLLYRWNAYEDLQINYSFGSEPTFSFKFIACSDREELIKTELSNGKEVSCFGAKWVVTNLQITKSHEYTKEIAVTVQLGHFLIARGTPSTSAIDRPIKLKKKNGNSIASFRTAAEIASLSGVEYTGVDIQVRTPKSTSSEEFTTLRQILEERAVKEHKFVYYSPNGVETRSWRGTRTHVISNSDVRNDTITSNYQGHGSFLNGVKLHTEYRNLQVNLDFSEDSDRLAGVQTDWIFENCNSLAELYSAAEDMGWYLKQPDQDVLRNPGINFDVGGAFTKIATRRITVNGTTTFEQRFEAGYAFTSKQTHEIEITAQGGIIIKLDTATFPQSYWGIVRQSTSDWIFDEYGYLTSINVSGTETARLQQESEKLEAVSLYAKALANPVDDGGITVPDPSLVAQAEAYEFTRNIPISDQTRYVLGRLRDHYDDVVKPSDCEDEDFVEPKFMREMRRSREDYFIAANPKNNEQFTYPQIVSGRYLKESETISLTSTSFPEKYEVRTRKQSNEGEYFKNSRAEGQNDYREGRPGIHTRLIRDIDYENNDDNGNYERYKNKNYYLNSVGVDSSVRVNEGSKSYPDVDDPNQVKAIAETELSIINTQNALTTSITIDWRSGIEVGDFAIFQGKRWKIFSIQDNRKIELNRIINESLDLTLGYYLEPKLILNDENNCSHSSSL